MRRLSLLLLGAALCLGSLAAQDSLLLVEKRGDLLSRARLMRKVDKISVHLVLDKGTPKDLAELLNAQAGKFVNFLVRPHEGETDYASLTFNLKSISLRNAMSLCRRMSDIRFVAGPGVVFICHKDDVKQLTTLRIYDVKAATFKLKDFPGTRIGIRPGDVEEVEPREIQTENTPSGFTLEQLEEMIRTKIEPDSWGEQASLSTGNGILIVRQTEEGHAKIRRLLWQLGVGTGPAPARARRRAKAKTAKSKPVTTKSRKKSSK